MKCIFPMFNANKPCQGLATFLTCGLLCAAVGRSDESTIVAQPELHVINDSRQAIDIYWLKSDEERVLSSSATPGKIATITTTLGHRFLIVGREDHKEATVTSLVPVQSCRFDVAGHLGVPAIYTQSVSANGYPIVATARVNPYALEEAAYLVNSMLAKRPDVRDAMIASGSRLSVMAYDEYTTDLPEFSRLKPKDYWDVRARGLGGSRTDPFCSCAEENLLAYPGDPYSTECILIHEFAHNLHQRGMVNVDSTFDRRLRDTYERAMAAGLWKDKYASVNHSEYFAEGVQSWFDNNRENDHDHNHVNTREELIAYDPGLAAICQEVFGDTALQYSKPSMRLKGHLAGYEPTEAPRFQWPERLAGEKASLRARSQARESDQAGDRRPTPAEKATLENDLDADYATRQVAGWTLYLRPALMRDDAEATTKAITLLEEQLQEIIRVVPAVAVAELKKVPLYFSPEYPGKRPAAEFHPNAGWLRSHGRDPGMAKGVEFTNIRIFEAETRRMPNFALHELAHAYHNLVLPNGFENPDLVAAFDRAKENGLYEQVERRDSQGRTRVERAYAMTTAMEYFAETSEAYFSRNDFFPYTRDELKRHDPEMFALLTRLWQVPLQPDGPERESNSDN